MIFCWRESGWLRLTGESRFLMKKGYLLCDDFIAYGGDGYDTGLFHTRIAGFSGHVTTDCLIQYLKECEVVPNNRYKIPEVTKRRAREEEGMKSTINGWKAVDGGNIEVTM
ncbi:hypothetical protein [Bacteroides fragilis]|uniref:hypothetical protein n=1 Tax=Bacteroides fragilis TaxID=817 RepID=UPI00189E2F52|nr:hypothetical protein [Bacteroides fragilis]